MHNGYPNVKLVILSYTALQSIVYFISDPFKQAKTGTQGKPVTPTSVYTYPTSKNIFQAYKRLHVDGSDWCQSSMYTYF